MQNRSTSQIFSALDKHVSRFADKNQNYSPTTVAEGLAKINGNQTLIKGTLIATFNATHASDNLVCPVTHGHFVPDKDTGYAKNLHMGTTRIWNIDGSVNEERWKQFVEFVTAGQNEHEEKIVTQSQLKKYLKQCYENDEQEFNSGRNTHRLFSSKSAQRFAAIAAWDEVFDRLTCGWRPVEHKCNEFEPYINLSLIREFFEDSAAAFKRAEEKELPVAKPANLASIELSFGR